MESSYESDEFLNLGGGCVNGEKRTNVTDVKIIFIAFGNQLDMGNAMLRMIPRLQT